MSGGPWVGAGPAEGSRPSSPTIGHTPLLVPGGSGWPAWGSSLTLPTVSLRVILCLSPSPPFSRVTHILQETSATITLGPVPQKRWR